MMASRNRLQDFRSNESEIPWLSGLKEIWVESLSRDISLSIGFLAPGNGEKTYNNTFRGSTDREFIN